MAYIISQNTLTSIRRYYGMDEEREVSISPPLQGPRLDIILFRNTTALIETRAVILSNIIVTGLM
jgi:hypothetical protein